MTKTPIQKCYECGGSMEGRTEKYRYVESGLKNVILRDILVFRCKECGAVVPEITGASSLHALIGIRLLFKDGRLSGDEIKFLRKLVGYSATELAQLAGTSKSVVSRWENKSTFGEHTDRLIRLICFNKMLRDALPALQNPENDKANHTLFDASGLTGFMEDTLKKLRNKSTKNTVEINRADLEHGFVLSAKAASAAVQ